MVDGWRQGYSNVSSCSKDKGGLKSIRRWDSKIRSETNWSWDEKHIKVTWIKRSID